MTYDEWLTTDPADLRDDRDDRDDDRDDVPEYLDETPSPADASAEPHAEHEPSAEPQRELVTSPGRVDPCPGA